MVNNKKKSILGDGGGLGALFAEQGVDTSVSTGDEIRQLEVTKIVSNPFQPRRIFDEVALKDLAASIKENGILQPIIVRHNPKNNQQYELLAGERRWRAAKLAQEATIPAIVRKLDDEQMMQASILENLQREDLTPLEEAQAYRDMMTTLHLTQDQVAKRLGKARSAVANLLRLLNLPAEVKDLVNAGKLSMGQARTLLGLRNKRRIVPVAKRVVAEGLTVRQLEQLVNKLNEQGSSEHTHQQPSAYLQATQTALEDKLGTKVQVTRNRKGAGKIEISYLSDEDLARIFEVLGIDLND
ncbi:ParB/RepB/Spo0J family partition protein [Weissella halotolerans]|uniref:ParB/RepB/Spo0J family partition protein n=1 Tax=Weissella halotolerans TaxID=1615 RepID=UPI0003B48C33|nr:ParB/RepB/Spo0J family partition protein [Weissella halotolerans]